MPEKKFGVVLRAVDPGKFGNLVSKKLITEVIEDREKGLSYFKSNFSKRELKVKLGLVYDDDIIEYTEQKIGKDKTDNKPEVTKPVEDELDQKQSDLNEKELKLKEKESELNKKAAELSLKEIGLSEKESELENRNKNSNSQSSIMSEKIKQKLKIEIPEIYGTEYEDIFNYAADLRTFKKLLKNDWTEEEIIFSSLVKSKKTALKASMTNEEETKIDKFVKFLFTIHGHSPSEMWKKLRCIKQKEDENVLQFFNRVVKLFYACRKSDVPETINDESHQQEIRNIFISGLNNIELRKQLNMNEIGITFENFGRTAQAYSNALKSAEEITNALNVLNIEASIMRKRDDWSDRDYSPSSRSRDRERTERPRERSYSRDRDSHREDRLCFRCGQKGHIVRNCRASARTISQYRKGLDRRSSSRDRNRNYSRESSRDRESRVRFEDSEN